MVDGNAKEYLAALVDLRETLVDQGSGAEEKTDPQDLRRFLRPLSK